MNIIITKDWDFHHYNGKNCYKKDLKLKVDRIVKDGALIEHFYGYGQNEIIPNEFFKKVNKK